MAEQPIIRKVRDGLAEWAFKSWPLSGHLAQDAVTGRALNRPVVETASGPEVVGVAHLLDPERFLPAVIDGEAERLESDDAKRLRGMFRVEVDEED